MTSLDTSNLSLLSIILALLVSVSLSTGSPIDPASAPELIKQTCTTFQENLFNYFQNYSLRMEDYEISNPKELNSKSIGICQLFLENANDFAHMASIKLSVNLKNSNWTLGISKTKTRDVLIPLTNWIQEEINYQLPQVANLINHSYKLLPKWENSAMHVTLMQTIRSRLTEKAPSKLDLIFQLTTFPSYESNSFTWYIKSKESYLGYVNLWMEETQEEAYLKTMDLTHNHVLKMEIRTVREGEFSSGTLETPVISSSDNDRDGIIDKTLTAFDFKHTFTNLEELIEKTGKYLNKHMPTLEITPIDKKILETDNYFYQRFKLKHEFTSSEMSIGTAMDGDASSYYINIDYENNNFAQPFVNLYFRRTSDTSLEKLFTDNGMDKLFRSVYQDVTDMFINEFELMNQRKTQNNTQDNDSRKPLVEYHESSGFNSTASDGFKNDDIGLNYVKDKAGKVTVILTSSKKSIEYKESFHFDKYKSEFVSRLINNFFLRYEEDLGRLL